MPNGSLIRSLVSSGFTESQAELITTVIVDKRNSDELTIGRQLALIEKEMATKANLIDIRLAISELKVDISHAKFDLLKWMIPFFVTIIGLIISLYL